jgi:8-oxo-dGTP pyrophosphatase MutT (NUDIX family)
MLTFLSASSIILVSPSNRILLIHRVRTSSAFPSAHVFPGGNLSPADGKIPPSGVERHKDNLAYRTGAIRELFEESGILLARDGPTSGLISVSAKDRLRGRKAIHSEKVRFSTWLKQRSEHAHLDTENLIPFTHWITPLGVPKRFSTQMYLYFVPVEEEGKASLHATSDEAENTAADWKTASEWIKLSRKGEIILLPPQFLLLYLCSLHLDKEGEWKNSTTRDEVKERRESLRRFVESDGSPPWRDKYISPLSLGHDVVRGGRTVLDLSEPGLELKGSGLSGDSERVILVNFRKEGPREVDVEWRKEVLKDARKMEEEQKQKGAPKL